MKQRVRGGMGCQVKMVVRTVRVGFQVGMEVLGTSVL